MMPLILAPEASAVDPAADRTLLDGPGLTAFTRIGVVTIPESPAELDGDGCDHDELPPVCRPAPPMSECIPEPVVHAMAQVAIEVWAGQRPKRHLEQLLAPRTICTMNEGGQLQLRNARVIKTLTARTSERRVDASVVIRTPRRMHAMSIGFFWSSVGWRIRSLDVL